jgi:hypothetical protein
MENQGVRFERREGSSLFRTEGDKKPVDDLAPVSVGCPPLWQVIGGKRDEARTICMPGAASGGATLLP